MRTPNRNRWALLVAAGLAAGLAAPVPAAAARRLFLWKVSSESATVHLLGSIHLAKPELYPLDPAIESAFERSPVLVVEVNLNELDPREIQRRFLEKGLYSDGTTLQENLSPATMERLTAFLRSRDIPVDKFQPMRPWMLSVSLGVMELERLGYDAGIGIDQHFLRGAAAGGKEVRSLETMRFQLELFSGFSPELQEQLLVYTLRDIDRLSEDMDTLVGAWQRGDVETIESRLLDPKELNGPLRPLYERLFFERNAMMTARIEEFLAAEGDFFVVIGAGHLVGRKGILDLLGKQKRWEIEQVAATGSISSD